MSEKKPNISRRALIGGLAGIVVLGGGAGVAAGMLGKDNTVVEEENLRPSSAPVETEAPKEIEVEPQDELEQKIAKKPEPKAPVPEPAPVVVPHPVEPDRSTFSEEQLQREKELSDAIPDMGARPPGE